MSTAARSGPPALVLAILLVQVFAPFAEAHHATRTEDTQATVTLPNLPLPPEAQPPSTVDVPDGEGIVRNETDTTPTLDQLRDQALDSHHRAVDLLNEELARRNLSSAALQPAVPGRVMLDPVEPGARIGGIGNWTVMGNPAWRPDAARGRDDTAGFVMDDPVTGGYAAGESWLVSPAIDLSAYLLQTGTLPFAGADVFAQATGSTDGNQPDGHILVDQINLLLNHRFNFKNGSDGGQVLLFLGKPPSSTRDRGIVLEPLTTAGAATDSASGAWALTGMTRVMTTREAKDYSNGVLALNGRGYTGASEWELAAFDLTPWAGKTVWIAFRTAAGPNAASDPSYFNSRFDSEDSKGWFLDDIEVVAPAYGKNLKVYGVDGPDFRASPIDDLSRIAPGASTTVSGIILNAGGTSGPAKAEIRVSSPSMEFVQTFSSFLQPGQVWMPNVTFDAPLAEDEEVAVSVRAWNVGTTNTTSIPNPPGQPGSGTRSFLVSAVARLEADLVAEKLMVDDNDPQNATARVRNTGNVPLLVELSLTDLHKTRNETTGNLTEPRTLVHDTRLLEVAPGGTAEASWIVDTGVRGEHLLNLTANATGAPGAFAQTRYYVHASPSPILAVDQDEPPGEGWTSALAHIPIPPEDEWVWGLKASPQGTSAVLRATPSTELADTGVPYTDLVLSVRYMPYLTGGISRVVISYASPVSPDNEQRETNTEIWRMDIPQPPFSDSLAASTNLSWRTIVTEVSPEEARGYVDAWSLRGLELRLRGPTLSQGGAFYLDDLRLTGVPQGRGESERVELIRMTGNDSATSVVPILETPPEVQSRTQTVVPSVNTVCLNTSARTVDACWQRLNATTLRAQAASTLWTQGNAIVAGKLPVFTYVGPTGAVPQRLVSPELVLTGAEDPILTLDHAYVFSSLPYDQDLSTDTFEYIIDQVGIVEMQYQRDDGNWSNFIRLEPEGGYPNVLGINGRTPNSNSRLRATDGFYYPPLCTSGAGCDNQGHYMNIDESGGYVWKQFLPTPHPELSIFRLQQQAVGDVDLTGRAIRLGFLTSLASNSFINAGGEWHLMGVRLTPVPQFAVDGAIENLSLAVPYDWRTLGVGPAEGVPVNVTVRNAGIFPEEFSILLGSSEPGGAVTYGPPLPIGELQPGERRSFILPSWNVSASLSGRAVVLTALVIPTDNRTFDDNVHNDVRTLGRETPLLVRSVVDIGIVASVYPPKGDASLPRLTPIVLRNDGNVPVAGAEVDLRIERLESGRIVPIEQSTWTLPAALAADPRGISLLSVDPTIRESELSFTPGVQGTYLLTVSLRTPALSSDQDLSDNVVRRFFEAAEPIYSEDFEGRLRWDTNDPETWGEGPGFRSEKALTALNRSSGLLKPLSDAWIVTPPIRLSDVQAATVSFLAKFDLEKGYDGGVLEISTDNKTWHRVPPVDVQGRPSDYDVPLVGSNPLAAEAGIRNLTRAISGSSWDREVQFDGWAPFSFDLANVPAISDIVAFRSLDAPKPTGSKIAPIEPGSPIGIAPWLVVDPTDEAGRWEVRNDRVREDVPRWWSRQGMGDGRAYPLSRTFTDLAQAPANSAIVVSWWDHRPGTSEKGWQGVGGEYHVQVQVEGEANPRRLNASVTSTAYEDGWHRLSYVLPSDIDRTKAIEVLFVYRSTEVSSTNLGWEIRSVAVQAFPTADNRVIPGSRALKSFTGNEESELDLWTGSWERRDNVPASPAPWDVTVGAGPDGRPRPLWQLTLDKATHSNVDARLVSPVVDLSSVGGGRTTLRLTHQYDLLWKENALLGGERLDQRKHYQAGTVEIQVFNRTSDAWDEPRQLYASGTPESAPIPRARTGLADASGAPYPLTLLEAGDPFDHYPRVVEQPFQSINRYMRIYDAPAPNVSYVYSGQSGGYVTDEFDLSPYRGERVRLVFHAWSSATDPEKRPHTWTISSADIVGSVLRSADARLRFRLATDESLLEGSWAIDQLEVTGLRYERSVGIHLEQVPTRADIDGMVTVRGTLRNHADEVRNQVTVGLRATGAPLTAPTAAPSGGTLRLNLSASAGYLAAAGPFDLAPAGKPGSEVPFEFRIIAGPQTDLHTLTLEALEATVESGALGYAPVDDDVPGRAARSWSFATERVPEATLDTLAPFPPSLDAPGEVTLHAKGRNTGTTNLNVTARLKVEAVDGTSVATLNHPVVAVAPGAAFDLRFAPVRLTTARDHILRVELLEDDVVVGQEVRRAYRVGSTDTLLTASFEQDLEGWTAEGTPGFAHSRLEARFGNGSALMGVEDDDYDRGVRVQQLRQMNTYATGTLTSPPVDLRAVGPSPVVGFWYKSRMDPAGAVAVRVRVLSDTTDEPHSDCPDWITVPSTTSLGGRHAEWQSATLSLAGIRACELGFVTDHRVQVRFDVPVAVGQGWRVDGVTIASGVPTLWPAQRAHAVTDGGQKEFPFVVENPGLVPKDIVLRVDAGASKLSPSQMKWATVEPATIRLAPGQSATGALRIDFPAVRGGFPQDLRVGVVASEASLPFLAPASLLDLLFEPKPRADLSLSAAVDGKALGSVRFALEEATPHEISLLVVNEGIEASRPTEARMRILDASGAVVWEHRQTIEALQPTSLGGEPALVAGSWKPTFGKRGNHTFEAVVDPERLQVDYDRADSSLRATLDVIQLVRPDLVVPARLMGVSTPDGKPVHETVPGSIIRVSGVVVNEGLAEARQVTVRVVAGSAVLKEELVPVLAPGASFQVFANQRAPAETTTYRIIAFTPDVELRSDNNEQTLELPVFPPELVIEAGPLSALTPGERVETTLEVINAGPYPALVNLSLSGDSRFATLGTRSLALAPGETRNVTLALAPGGSERAGVRKVLVLAETAEGLRTRRTVEVEVEAVPEAALVPHLARGAPSGVRVELDVLNTGNVELRPEAVVRDASGAVIAREKLAAIDPGATRFTPVSVRLPDATPPGALPATLTLEEDGRVLAETTLSLDVQPWSRVSTRVTPSAATEGRQSYALALTYEGNAPATRRPVLFGAPDGVVARYDRDAFDLRPGETRNLTLDVRAANEVPSGVYLLQVGLLDPENPSDQGILGNLTSIRLDLRRGEVDLVQARRVGAQTPTSGDDVSYVATLRNSGDSATGKLPVLLYVDGALVAREEMASLGPGETREIRLTYPAVAGLHGVVLAVDPHGPHRNDTVAFAETLDVKASALGVDAGKRLPAPSGLLVLGALALLAVALRRRDPPRAK